jgi:hypothetical protein
MVESWKMVAKRGTTKVSSTITEARPTITSSALSWWFVAPPWVGAGWAGEGTDCISVDAGLGADIK